MQNVSKASADQLLLFAGGGIDLARIRLGVDEMSGRPRAALTSRGYDYDFASFSRWCHDAGKSPLPASVDTIRVYVGWRIQEKSGKVTTASRHIAAIVHAHVDRGLPSPADTDPEQWKKLRRYLANVRRQRRERPVGKRAVELADLRRIARICATGTRGLRDRAMIILGFATSLRRSEISRLQLSDVSFEREGLVIEVRHSKTDQIGYGRPIAVWAGKRASTDPVRVLKAWIKRRGSWDGPLFCRVSQTEEVLTVPLSGDAICRAVKRAVSAVGIDPANYGAHSLRAGAVTTAAEMGAADHELRKMSGHKTDAMVQRYIRSARLFAGRNPFAGAL